MSAKDREDRVVREGAEQEKENDDVQDTAAMPVFQPSNQIK